MKELRCSSDGALRVLFAFDPRRQAVLLIGGDKTGSWNDWYEEAVPEADRRYATYLGCARNRGGYGMSAKKFNQLRSDLYERSPESERRVAVQVDRLNEQLGLAGLRARSSKTQAEVAEAIGTTQSAVFADRTTRRSVDLESQRLRKRNRSAGYDLSPHTTITRSRSTCHPPISVMSRSDRSESSGRTDNHANSCTSAGSTAGRATTRRLHAGGPSRRRVRTFPGLPTFGRSMRRGALRSFRQPAWLRITRRVSPTRRCTQGASRRGNPIELLARAWGSRHPTMPPSRSCPNLDLRPDGVEVTYFLASGVRHVDEAKPERTEKLVRRPSARERASVDSRNGQPGQRSSNQTRDQEVGKSDGWRTTCSTKSTRLNHALRTCSSNTPTAPIHLGTSGCYCRLELRESA